MPFLNLLRLCSFMFLFGKAPLAMIVLHYPVTIYTINSFSEIDWSHSFKQFLVEAIESGLATEGDLPLIPLLLERLLFIHKLSMMSRSGFAFL